MSRILAKLAVFVVPMVLIALSPVYKIYKFKNEVGIAETRSDGITAGPTLVGTPKGTSHHLTGEFVVVL